MKISKTEYEQRRHVFDLYHWINTKLKEMELLPDFSKTYFERQAKNTNVKRLIEEAMPIASLGLYFCRPPNDVFIRCLAGNQRYDAELSVTGWHNFDIRVEATTVENEDSTLRRQALSRNGTVFMTGTIKRDGENIVSEPQMVDLDKESQKWIDLAFERALRKMNGGYGKDTAVLVNFNSFRHIPLRYRAKLLERTKRHLQVEKPEIYGVYYSYADDFVVDGVKVFRRNHTSRRIGSGLRYCGDS